MPHQIRGIILEGQSCSGKTSVFNSIRKCHLLEDDTERNVIYLSEHYSQTLNWINGELRNLSPEDNIRVLSDRLSMLEQLNDYANSMGEHTRRSRGLFFVFERFHLNYAFCSNDISSKEYQKIEQRLHNLNTQVVLCTISDDKIEERLKHRAIYTKEEITRGRLEEYKKNQLHFISIAKKSSLPTMTVNTDDLDWDNYARMILNQIN